MKNDYSKVFKELGARYRKMRLKNGLVQEDAIEHGFSVRHYQQLEAGRSHTVVTLLRVAAMFKADPAGLLKGLKVTPAARTRRKP
jgi:transcriptional regulator with XRE-family HTH domain